MFAFWLHRQFCFYDSSFKSALGNNHWCSHNYCGGWAILQWLWLLHRYAWGCGPINSTLLSNYIPMILAEKTQPDLSPWCTEPTIYTTMQFDNVSLVNISTEHYWQNATQGMADMHGNACQPHKLYVLLRFSEVCFIWYFILSLFQYIHSAGILHRVSKQIISSKFTSIEYNVFFCTC